MKTATQCKSFFDDYRDDPYLQLHKALAEHNIIKVVTSYLFELTLNVCNKVHHYYFIMVVRIPS